MRTIDTILARVIGLDLFKIGFLNLFLSKFLEAITEQAAVFSAALHNQARATWLFWELSGLVIVLYQFWGFFQSFFFCDTPIKAPSHEKFLIAYLQRLRSLKNIAKMRNFSTSRRSAILCFNSTERFLKSNEWNVASKTSPRYRLLNMYELTWWCHRTRTKRRRIFAVGSLESLQNTDNKYEI